MATQLFSNKGLKLISPQSPGLLDNSAHIGSIYAAKVEIIQDAYVLRSWLMCKLVGTRMLG